jgi:hypothetical protein
MSDQIDAYHWAILLRDRYFSPAHAGETVTFSVDRDELAEMSGLSPDDAAASLVTAVRSQVMPFYEFRRVQNAMAAWLKRVTKDREVPDPPPVLPLLALNVLVASEMAAKDGQGRPPFYEPLRAWLDPNDHEVGPPGDYARAVPRCWEMLKTWLDDLLEGRRGLSTITRHEHLVNIGYALQQAVLRTIDRRRLSRFFRAIGLEPHDEEVAGSELRQALAFWSKRQGARGARLYRLATDSSVREYAEHLLELIARRWDGTIRNERTGAPAAPLRLFIRQRPFLLGLAALKTDELPHQALLECQADKDHFILLEADDKGAYTPLPLELNVDANVLDHGLTFESRELTLYLESADAYAFHRHPAVDPDWVSTSQIQLGEPHLLLVRRELRFDVESWLRKAGAQGELAIRATEQLPRGWVLFHGVRIDGYVEKAPPPAIADFLRAGGGSRLKLVGGLRIPGVARAYFTGGAPVLALPSESGSAFTVELEGYGTEKFVATNGNHLLGRVLSQPGTYHVRHELGEFEFDLTDGFSVRPGSQVGRIAPRTCEGTRISGLVTGAPAALVPRSARVRAREGEIIIGRGGRAIAALVPSWLPGLESRKAAIWFQDEPVWLITRDDTNRAEIECLALEMPQSGGAGAGEFARLRGIPLSAEATGDERALLELYLEAADD